MAQTCNSAEALIPLVARIEQLDVRYCLCGSLAAAFYGVCDSWSDVELVAELSPAHVRPLFDAVQREYWMDPRLAASAVADQSAFALVHLPTAMKVIVHISKRRPYDVAAMNRVRRDAFGNDPKESPVLLPSPEDVVLSKLEWYRLGDEVSDRQWRDVIGVMKVVGTTLDRPYMVHWAGELGVADLLEKAWKEAEADNP
jgi:hypothetical protein